MCVTQNHFMIASSGACCTDSLYTDCADAQQNSKLYNDYIIIYEWFHTYIKSS